ncbi:MAG: 30S ribosomal protein S16 [Bdellovibrionales bacterium]
MVTIRLARCGRTHAARYRVVAADSRSRRDGKFLDIIGHYNPSPRGEEKSIVLDLDKIKKWEAVGAQTSDRVKSIIREAAKN